MAAILKLRRGTSIPSLVESELFFNTTNKTVVVGDGSTQHTLVKIGTNTGSVEFTGDITASNITITGNALVEGNITFGGSLITLGDENTDDIVFVGELSSSLIPNNDNAFDIGSSVRRYKTIYGVSASFENVSLPGTGILSSSLQDFDTYSSSIESQLDSVYTFTQSADQRLTSIEGFTQSIDLRVDDLEASQSYFDNTFSASVDSRLVDAESTGSDHESRIDVIETTFSSSVDLRLDNLESTGSDHESRLDEIETTFSSSVDQRLDNAEWTGSNQEGRLDTIETTFSSSVDLRLDDLEFFSSSEYQIDSSSFDSRLDTIEGAFSTSVDLRLDDLESTGSNHESRIIDLESTGSDHELRIDEIETTFSSSVDERLNDAEWTGSNQEGRLDNLELSQSYFDNTFSGSVDLRLDDTEWTGSDHEGRITSIEGYSASLDSRLDDLESTGSDHESRLDTIEGPFSSSLDSRLNSLNLYTQSNDLRVDDLEATGSDHESRLDTIEGPLSSSIDNQLNTIQSYTASLKNAIEVSGQNLTVFGDLVVEGTTTTINTQELLIEDKLLAIASGSTTSTDADGGGFFISGANASILWNHLDQTLDINTKVSSSVGFKGDGSELSNLQYSGIVFDGSGIVSGSSQIDLTQTTNYISGIKDRLNAEGIFSQSAQVNANDITNFDTNVKDKLDADNVHSGSYLGTATTSNLTEGSRLYYTDSRVKTKLDSEGVISSSAQLESVFLEINGDDVVSGSSQIIFNQISENPFTSGSNAITASGHFVPSQHEIYDLGSTELSWRDLYLSGSTIHLGGTLISINDSGDVEFINESTQQPQSAIVNFDTITNKPTLVSGSSQVDLTQTTNYISGIKDRLDSETVVSGSDQVTASLDLRYLEINGDSVFSSSEQVDADFITNFDANVKDKLDSETVVSGSDQVTASLDNRYLEIFGDDVVSGSDQLTASLDGRYLEINGDGVFTSSVQVDITQTSGYESFSQSLDGRLDLLEGDQHTHSNKANLDTINQDLSTADVPTFANISLPSITSLPTASEFSVLLYSQSGEITYSELGTAAYYHVSQSISQEDDNVIGTAGALKRYIDEQLVIIGAGDITAVTPTSGGGLSGGGLAGHVSLSLDTASAHFTNGVLTSINSFSSSVDTRLDDLEAFSSSLDGDFVTQVELSSATGALENSIATKLDTGSYNTDSQSFDSRIDTLEGETHENPLTFNDTTTIDLVRTGDVITAKAIGGIVSGSSQIDLTQTTNYSQGIKSILDGNSVVSGSDQVTQSLDSHYLRINGDSVISGSSQVILQSADKTGFTGAGSITTLGTVTSGNVTAILPNGVVSGSSQVDVEQTTNFNTFSSSLDSRLDTLEGTSNENPLTFNDTPTIDLTRTGDVVTAKAIGGIVSSSAQISGYNTFLEINGDSVVSSSAQISAYNTFLEKDGDGVISGSDQLTSSLVDIASAQSISGTKTFEDIIVNGTGSFAYIQSVTGSAKIIGDAFVVVNNDTPTERYAGLAVYDSGSANTTASLFFDGQLNDWNYEYNVGGTVDYGVVMFGPEYNTKGSPTYLTNNRIPKGDGGHHLNDSNITDSGTLITLGSNVQVSGNIALIGTVDGIDLQNFSSSVDGRLDTLEGESHENPLTFSDSTTIDFSRVGDTITANAIGGIISGSSQITLSGDVTGTANANTVGKIQGVSITSGEATQLANINTTTISTTQWGYVGALNQGLTQSSNVQFGIISGSAVHSEGTITAEGDVVAYASSDERLKDQITPIENSLEKISKIGGYSFVWNEKQDIYRGKDYGVIAQEIENILPELVETRQDGYKAVKYDRMVSLLIEGIKELSKEVSELKEKIGK